MDRRVGLQVDSRGRLVEKQDLRLSKERSSKAEELSLSATEVLTTLGNLAVQSAVRLGVGLEMRVSKRLPDRSVVVIACKKRVKWVCKSPASNESTLGKVTYRWGRCSASSCPQTAEDLEE